MKSTAPPCGLVAVVVETVELVGNSERSGELSTNPQASAGSARLSLQPLPKSEGLADEFEDMSLVG